MRRSSSSDTGSGIALLSHTSSSMGSAVLVLNAGSSSLKWVVLDAGSEAVRQQGDATWQGGDVSRHQSELQVALERAPAVDAVGHRVVHGGARFREAVLIDDRVR